MYERPCDCAGRHMQFLERSRDAVMWELLHPPTRPHMLRPVPAMHQHEDARCSEEMLGIGGCPGLPHCRDWIVGAYRVGASIAEITDDKARAAHLHVKREEIEHEFARRSPLQTTDALTAAR